MRSSPPQSPIGDPDDLEDTIQGTLDAFEDLSGEEAPEDGTEQVSEVVNDVPAWGAGQRSKQSSIDTYGEAVPEEEARERSPAPGSRAQAGIALERDMERVALREAVRGITRDELVITVARECEVPLEDLELVDCFVSDLVLEGKLRTMEDLVALAQDGDADLYAMCLARDEFLELYRRRYRSVTGGDGE